MLVPR